MDSEQKYIRKVKLQLIQPKIKCSGRGDVTCFYNGKVIMDEPNSMIIVIKVYGKEQPILWDKINNCCITAGFTDLKIK